MIALDVLVDRLLRPLPQIVDIGLSVKRGQQGRERRHAADIGRNIDVALLEVEIRRPAAAQGEGDVLAESGGLIAVLVFGDEFLDAGERRNIAFREFLANRQAQRMIAGGCQVGVVPRRIDRGHHREKSGAGVKLAGFRGAACIAGREGQELLKTQSDTIHPL